MNPAEEIIKDFARGIDDSSLSPDGIIMNRKWQHWAVKVGDHLVLLPRGGDESFYEESEVVHNGGDGVINGLCWYPVKFDPRYQVLAMFKEGFAIESQFGADNLFGKEAQVVVNGVEAQFVVADHQGPEVTLVFMPS